MHYNDPPTSVGGIPEGVRWRLSRTDVIGLTPHPPPELLYHGTVERFVSSIMASGLDKQSRQHVHLSPDIDTAIRVGSRRGEPVILKIAAGSMHADGFQFVCSENGVWLTERVPPQYISKIVTR